MAFKYSEASMNASLDAVETAIGASAILKIRVGSAPTNCAAADAGAVLATMTLPSDWMAAASGAIKALSGTWQDLSADSTGVAGHFRVYANNGTTCHIQGNITATGGGGDMTLDNTSIASGQQITVTSFTINATSMVG